MYRHMIQLCVCIYFDMLCMYCTYYISIHMVITTCSINCNNQVPAWTLAECGMGIWSYMIYVLNPTLSASPIHFQFENNFFRRHHHACLTPPQYLTAPKRWQVPFNWLVVAGSGSRNIPNLSRSEYSPTSTEMTWAPQAAAYHSFANTLEAQARQISAGCRDHSRILIVVQTDVAPKDCFGW